MSESPAPSPSKGAATGSLKSRIAAFESGAASNASWANTNNKDIQAANINTLRSKFDREDDKPLRVLGSFGLGAPAPHDEQSSSSGKGTGLRAVSLGGGRAASPIGSPSVVVPSPRTPSASQQRPTSIRSTSSASTAASSNATTVSSLLPTPLQATLSSRNNSLLSDDASGLKTPMSSISLSSMAVETGSTVGDASVRNDADEEQSQPGTPLNEVETPSLPAAADTAARDDPMESTTVLEPGSAAQLEKAEKSGVMPAPQADSGEDTKVSSDDVQKAKDELERYEKEEPSAPAADQALATTPQDVPRLDIDDISEQQLTSSDKAEETSPAASPLNRTSSTKSSPSRPSSYISPRLKRSSTANSLADSQPESDLADTNLDVYDADRLGINPQIPASSKEAGPAEPMGETDIEKAKEIGESMAPHPTRPEDDTDAPIAPPRVVAESVNLSDPEGRDAHSVDVPVDDDETDVDEAGMPKVKCSDCGEKVSLMALGEHVCAPASDTVLSPSKVELPPTPGQQDDQGSHLLHARGLSREGVPVPSDVPTSDFSPSPVASPQTQPKPLPNLDDAPDVPEDADERESIAGSATEGKRASFEHVEREEPEEDYMTALTSRRDSMDTVGTRPMVETPSSSARNLAELAEEGDEDEETEVLAFPISRILQECIPTLPLESLLGSQTPLRQTRALVFPDSPATTLSPPDTAKPILSPLSPYGTDTDGVGARKKAVKSKSAGLGDTDSESEAEPGTVTIIR